MKLALVISSLGGGGAERVMSTVANALVSEGVLVTLITLSDEESDIYRLDPRVKRIGLGLIQPAVHFGQAIKNNWRRLRAVRQALLEAQPDVVLSFMTTTNILSIIACARTNIPVVVSERISIEDEPPRGVWSLMYRYVYRRSDAVVTLTQRGAAYLERILGVPVHVIPNPVQISDHGRNNSSSDNVVVETSGERILLAMGRLSKAKGFDLLISAFAKIASNYRNWSLLILGEGPEHDSLQLQAEELGLSERVMLAGFVLNPQSIMRRVHIFALSSRYEGMPNALMEAMAAGLPCVSFDCRTGPAELIDHGTSGLLVPAENVTAFALALSRLMENDELREDFGAVASAAMQQYRLDAVLNRWQMLFEQVRN